MLRDIVLKINKQGFTIIIEGHTSFHAQNAKELESFVRENLSIEEQEEIINASIKAKKSYN